MRSVTLVVVCAGLLGASSVPTTPKEPQGGDKFVLEAGSHSIQLLREADAPPVEAAPTDSEWRQAIERRLQALEERAGR